MSGGRAWKPSWGAWSEGAGTRFRVWAPRRERVEVVLEPAGREPVAHLLNKEGDGSFAGFLEGVGPGDRYRYRLDGARLLPDPASRFQPEGVHGPSQVVDPSRFAWSDDAWTGVALEDLVTYELHVGTFTPAGTFAAARERLSHLAELGVTAAELMPLADFPGSRNWGYDGVSLFAPARCYGPPDELRELVDAAHRAGLAVIQDVVYNHFGPDGASMGAFSPFYLTKRHQTPWGAAVNLDGEHSALVREFLIENALHWVHEYHMDGLRLDATHALVDESPRPFLAELAARVRGSVSGRKVLVIAEDDRNLARMLRPEVEGGWGLDAVWADDFHHQMRRGLAGDHEGYFQDFSGRTEDLAETLRRGWFFRGQLSAYRGGPRGTDPAGLAPRQFVICLQNHDQVGNRAFGERLNHQIDLAAYRAAAVLLLCAPESPLLFMGQEWAAATPFLFFTDHDPELGRLVRDGRRREFKAFSAFSDPHAGERIPDPQDAATFRRSTLDWTEPAREPHASTLRLHRALLALRRAEPLLREATWDGFDAAALGEDALVLRRMRGAAAALLVVAKLRGSGPVEVALPAGAGGEWEWATVLDTEDPAFCPDPQPVGLDRSGAGPRIRFSRPGAVVLKGSRPSTVRSRSAAAPR